ncbi:ABC transporter ATP-binding protein [Bacillus velezensis]|uniref:ABC transporter ATP-binding protein n=1 Tax=Bacillus velezensis TaxID=492670 RepID=UPI0007F86812|nr:ABC transporter ATP-binding protein [Bacillus velezensis]AWQ15999.1 ABC transporter ATP-binding protein [Bacillus velezensis]MEC0446388.1 ABC transporter ATP-binding protein [Bacillus velezensis]OBR29833.1 Nisin transport ATP-binding protein NisT [Bacillus velezensis]OCB96106.1 Nisin transport ATP-binding protein NisT [Bacillus velezensis]QMI87124.1 ABC transporter ATP-binding protein [Bacillus velezensis]
MSQIERKNNSNPLKKFLYSQKYFLKLIYREHPKSLIFFFLLSLMSGLIAPTLISLNKHTIDSITEIKSNPDIMKFVILLLIITFFLQYLSAIIDNIDIYIFARITQTVNYVLKKITIEKLTTIPLEKFENSNFFDTINLANTAISGNGVKVISSVIGILTNLVSLIGIFGILLSIHWSMPIALFVSTLPGIILIFIAKSKNYKMNISTSPLERELAFTDSLFTNKSSLKEIKIYNLGEYLISKWSDLYKCIQKQNLNLAGWEARTKSLAAVFLQLTSLGVSLLLINQISHNVLSIGDYVALLGAVTTVQVLFSSIGGNLGSIFETAIFNNALMELLEYEVKSQTTNETNQIEEIKSLRLDNVSFAYPGTELLVLNDISLTINKGENVSIVGYNGSGKTTLVKCLIGLYGVNKGDVYVNDININRINKEKFYERVSAIFQDFFKYKYSVRENVAFGDLEKLQNDKEIFKLLKNVGISGKIKSFDEKLETYLTREIPDGRDLSGGEWQRIAIARGFLKDSDLIILDEPTAAVDPIMELEIFDLFNRLSENKTTITISHRLGPTKFSDRIIVMDKGRIVEEGSFHSLMEQKGLYYRMYQSQSNWYNEEIGLIEV